jgi:TetR/AcrR family transcriptional regulator, regulator of biofilm formation and stress response
VTHVVYVAASERATLIVAAARGVLAREGVVGTTLRMVAAEAKVPLGTLHYVFPSREQLLRAVLEQVTDDLAGIVRNAIRPGMGFGDAVAAAFESYWRLVEQDPQTRAAEFELLLDAIRRPNGTELSSWQYGRYIGDAVEAFQVVLDSSGESLRTPLRDVIRVMIAASDGLVVQFLADPDRRRARADLKNVILAVVAVAGPQPAQGPRQARSGVRRQEAPVR